MGEPRQLVLDLRHRAALGAEDFLVSSANRAAVAMIDRWPDWPHPAAMVVGPAQCGKSHLAHVWRLRSGAPAPVPAGRLGAEAIGELGRAGALVIEDLDQGIGDERALFHLLNIAREDCRHLLLTSARPAGDLGIALPDLRSRLRALPCVTIESPDPELLKAVLVKLFTDRQLVVEPHVIGYLALHMERSFAAAARLAEAIDRQALAVRRKVTRALAAEVLAAAPSTDPEGGAA